MILGLAVWTDLQQDRFLHHRIDDGLHRSGQTVELDGLLDDVVPPHDEAVAGEDLVVGRVVSLSRIASRSTL